MAQKTAATVRMPMRLAPGHSEGTHWKVMIPDDESEMQWMPKARAPPTPIVRISPEVFRTKMRGAGAGTAACAMVDPFLDGRAPRAWRARWTGSTGEDHRVGGSRIVDRAATCRLRRPADR